MSYNVIQKALARNNKLSADNRNFRIPLAPDCKACGHPHKQHFVLDMGLNLEKKTHTKISRCAGGGKIGCSCRIYKQY